MLLLVQLLPVQLLLSFVLLAPRRPTSGLLPRRHSRTHRCPPFQCRLQLRRGDHIIIHATTISSRRLPLCCGTTTAAVCARCLARGGGEGGEE